MIRNKAIEDVISRKPVFTDISSNISEYYGIFTFNLETMKKYLTSESYKNVENSINSWGHIDKKTANEVAAAMKTWTTNLGATHYTHWFHPLNNVKPYLEEIRYHIDKLELIVDDELWPLPKYRELLFVR